MEGGTLPPYDLANGKTAETGSTCRPGRTAEIRYGCRAGYGPADVQQ